MYVSGGGAVCLGRGDEAVHVSGGECERTCVFGVVLTPPLSHVTSSSYTLRRYPCLSICSQGNGWAFFVLASTPCVTATVK